MSVTLPPHKCGERCVCNVVIRNLTFTVGKSIVHCDFSQTTTVYLLLRAVNSHQAVDVSRLLFIFTKGISFVANRIEIMARLKLLI